MSDYLAAFFARSRAKFDDPVGTLQNLKVVFDDKKGVSCLDDFLQALEQPADVLHVQACGRFVYE